MDSKESIEVLAKSLTRQEKPETKSIAVHIDNVWRKNSEDNKQIRKDMLDSLRRSKGQYSQEKLTAIRAFKGSEAFIRFSENKACAAESWIKDIYRAEDKGPWDIEPTAIPDLPDETKSQVEQEVRQYAAQQEQELMMSGLLPDMNAMASLMQDYYEQRLDEEMEKLDQKAKKRCERAVKVIEDQNQEGKFDKAFKDFIYYFVRLKAGIIKGPILTKKPKQVWQVVDGNYELVPIETLVYDVYAVSPFNFYPSKGMKDINDGDTIEIHELTKQSLSNLIGTPGYSDEELKAVIYEFEGKKLRGNWLDIQDDTEVKQVTRNDKETTTLEEKIIAQEFYGTVPGKMLKDWGVTGEIDEYTHYQANCWKIGPHVIKAVINPDNLGRKPYHMSSWFKNPEWIWGESLIDFAGTIEDIINALIRATSNNAAIASGPMCEYDKDRVNAKIPMHPWRQIESTSLQMKSEGPAVVYYQPQMHLGELINAITFFMKILDEMTVPAYAQGASQSGVTAGTATVYTSLLANAARSIKSVVANIDDDVLAPYIQMCYDNVMKFTDDNTLKGDARAVAKGVAGLSAKEQQAQRKVEYLQVVTNPVLAQILGQKNLGAILSQIAKSNDIVLPDTGRLDGSVTAEELITSMLSAQAGVDPNQVNGQMGAGGGAPTEPEGMNPDGSRAGIVNE